MDGLDQYDAEQFEQQQFGTAGVEGVNDRHATLQCYGIISTPIWTVYSEMWPCRYRPYCMDIAVVADSKASSQRPVGIG